MKFQPTQSGYSLVEVLIAVTVLLIAIVGPLTIASKGLKNATDAKEQNTAFFLAQEGIEALVKAREDNALEDFFGSASDPWSAVQALDNSGDCSNADPCGYDVINQSFFLCSASGETCDVYARTGTRGLYTHETSGAPTQYRREIFLDSDDPGAYMHIRSAVTWGAGTIDETVELSMYVYNIYEN